MLFLLWHADFPPGMYPVGSLCFITETSAQLLIFFGEAFPDISF